VRGIDEGVDDAVDVRGEVHGGSVSTVILSKAKDLKMATPAIRRSFAVFAAQDDARASPHAYFKNSLTFITFTSRTPSGYAAQTASSCTVGSFASGTCQTVVPSGSLAVVNSYSCHVLP
jgi:hypothetical protein